MKTIEYPINVNKINVDNEVFSLYEPGGFAKVRPCAEKYGDKTYLGIFLGEIPTSAYVTYNTKTEELNVGLHGNPAIFVFELNKIIYGYESWWSRIENEEDLKDITDADISNVWYAKALRSIASKKNKIMKAWLVRVKNEFCAEVVFAETRGRAKALALSTDCCEDARFIDIEVHRQSQIDKYYKEGKWHLDWDNPQDRIILVKECGFWCGDEAFEFEDCKNCSAKMYCDRYTDTPTE